jgi:hypothetical protein
VVYVAPNTDILGTNLSAGGLAYSNTVNWLVGAQMKSKTIDSNGTWMIELQRQDLQWSHIVWNPEIATNLALPPTWNVFQRRDLSGGVTGMSGATSVNVGVTPIILDGYTTATVPGLSTALSSGSLIVAWPLNAAGYVLLQSADLSRTDGWTEVPLAYRTNSDGFRVIIDPWPDTNMFYRLRRP